MYETAIANILVALVVQRADVVSRTDLLYCCANRAFLHYAFLFCAELDLIALSRQAARRQSV